MHTSMAEKAEGEKKKHKMYILIGIPTSTYIVADLKYHSFPCRIASVFFVELLLKDNIIGLYLMGG